ncbi:MAG TPA: hypothetical protein VGE40_07530 [Bacilli bacterium]
MNNPAVTAIRNHLLLAAYCVYLYFFYHLLVQASFAEFSFYAMLWVPLLIFAFWLIPVHQRKQALVITFLFVFMDQAIENVYRVDRPLFYFYVAFIGLFLFPLTRWYARIRLTSFIIVFAAAFLFNVILPNQIVQALPHLYLKWKSEPLYVGDITGDFPIALKDIDQNGTKEIITLGNADEYPGLERKRKIDATLKDEPLSLFIWQWEKGAMVRVPNDSIAPELKASLLPEEYIGFPYYVMDPQFVLHPLIQKQPLSEGMMQFGTAPFRAMLINYKNISHQLTLKANIYDSLEKAGGFTNLILQNGLLKGVYNKEAFEVPSTATKIVGSIQLQGGKEGLLVLGLELTLLQMTDGKLTATNSITRDMQSGLAQSRMIVSDINGDGAQELVVAYPFSKILSPNDSGSWDILWNTDERSFRIRDIGAFAAETPTSYKHNKEIIALSKSAVRASDISYLTSYHYTEQGLVQNWKIFLRNISKVALGDVNGDGKQELVTMVYGQHTVFVWGKHHIPVTWILIGMTLLLLVYLSGRRFRHV